MDMEVRAAARRSEPYLRGRPRGGLARRTLTVAAIVVLLMLLLYPMVGDNGLGAFLRLRSERDRLQQEVERLEFERRRLTAEIESLQGDPATLERFARENYNMAQPGETVLRLVPEHQAEKPSP